MKKLKNNGEKIWIMETRSLIFAPAFKREGRQKGAEKREVGTLRKKVEKNFEKDLEVERKRFYLCTRFRFKKRGDRKR